MFDSVTNGFLDLPPELSSYNGAKVVILPIGYDLTSSYGIGARLGPQAIITASHQLEAFDDDLNLDPSEVGIATLPELALIVSGPEAMQQSIYESCSKLLDDNKYVLTLGGEHSITSALVRAHRDKHENLSVLHLDAHTDLRDSYQGSPYSHACVMSRVAGIVPFVSVGIRSFSGSANESKYRSNIYRPGDLRKAPEKIKKSMANLTENVYISIDLDCFDPSVMPSVGTPEPGGLTWDEVMWVVNTLASSKKIVGADIVELAPRPALEYANFTAAKLAYRVIARSFFKG